MTQEGEVITGTVENKTLGTAETSLTGTLKGGRMFLKSGSGGYIDASVSGDTMTGKVASGSSTTSFDFAAVRRK